MDRSNRSRGFDLDVNQRGSRFNLHVDRNS